MRVLYLCSLLAATPSVLSQEWGYVEDGLTGPSNWADSFPDCALQQQSPVNIVAIEDPGTTHALEWSCESLFELHVENKVKTIEYEPSIEGACQLTLQTRVGVDRATDNTVIYDLLQFHVHSPSEHTVDGVAFDLEVHFVHQNAAGELAVVGVLYRIGAEDNEWLSQLLAGGIPAQEETSVHTLGEAFTPTHVVGSAPVSTVPYLRYAGSLTTPPCSEGVQWNVVSPQQVMSAAQLKAYTTALGFNDTVTTTARPVQELNDRTFFLFTPADESQDDDDGLSDGEKTAIGGSIGGAVLLAGIVFLAYKYSGKSRTADVQKHEPVQADVENEPIETDVAALHSQ